jgi:membrane protein YqaA with SNARE-associated domain
VERIAVWFRDLPEKVVVLAAAPSAVGWLFVWSFAESSFWPIPPDVLLVAMCLARPSMSFLFAAVCSAASVLGALLGYAIGFWGGRPIAYRLVAESRMQAAEELYRRYDVLAIGIAGFTPIPYKVFTILSGLLRVALWRFVAASAVSRSARFFLVAAVLYLFGDVAREFIVEYFGPLTLGLAILVVVGFLALGWYHRRSRRRDGTDEPSEPDAPPRAETDDSDGDASGGETVSTLNGG